MREGEELLKKSNKTQRFPEGVEKAEKGRMEMIRRWREKKWRR